MCGLTLYPGPRGTISEKDIIETITIFLKLSVLDNNIDQP